MADDMNLEIVIGATDQTDGAFAGLDEALRSIRKLAEEISGAFDQFARSIDAALKGATASMKELGAAGEAAGKIGTEGIKAVDESVKAVEKDARAATEAIDKMNQVAAKGAGGKGGHKGEGEGIFGMQGQMNSLYAGMALGAPAAALDLGIKQAIDTYSQFSQAVANVNSMLGYTPAQVNALSQQLIELSKIVPEGPGALADALYGIVGAGVPAKDAMDVLKTAAEAAAAGQTDVATATSALISVMDSYGMTGKDVAKIADQMFAANAAGAMTFDQFAKAIGTVAGPAAQAGVSFDQVAAATAALTNQGLSAQRATEGLRALLIGIMSPTKEAAQEAAKLGIEWDANALKQKGLVGMLQEAMKATGGNSEELKKLIPNIAAWTVAVDLGGKGAESFKQAMDQMAQSSGATGRALAAQEQGFTEQMNRMKASIEAAQISFVAGFAPALTAIADKIAELARWFQNLSPHTQKLIGEIVIGAAAFLTLGSSFFMAISGFGALVSGVKAVAGALALEKEVSKGVTQLTTFGKVVDGLGKAFAGMTNTAISALSRLGAALLENPMLIVFGLIAMAVAVLAYEIYKHWDQIKAFLEKAWSAIHDTAIKVWEDIKNAIVTAWNAIVDFFKPAVDALIAFWKGEWDIVKTVLTAVWDGIKVYLQAVWDTIKTIFYTAVLAVYFIFTGHFDKLGELFHKSWEKLKQIWSQAFEQIKQIVRGAWDHIHNLFQAAYLILQSIVEHEWAVIQDKFKMAWDKLKQHVHDGWENIKQSFNDAIDKVKRTVEDFWNNLKTKFSDGMNNAWQAIKDIWNSVVSWFESLPSMALQWGRNLIQGFIDGIKSMASAVGSAVSHVVQAAKNFLGMGGSSGSVPIHAMAKGGLVTQPTFALVGEAGPELVIPLREFGRMISTSMSSFMPDFSNFIHVPSPVAAAPVGYGGHGGGDTYVYITVQGNVIRERELTDIVSRGLWKKAKTQGKF